MALPFCTAMATHSSTSLAACSCDQRERCLAGRAADGVEQGEGVLSDSSASLDHEGNELGVVLAGDGCVLPALLSCHILGRWQSSSQAVSRAVDAERMHHRDVCEHVSGQGTRSAGQGEACCFAVQARHLPHRLSFLSTALRGTARP